MTHRPYPNADRALRHIQYKRAVYQYGRCPQRYVMVIDTPPTLDPERVNAAIQNSMRQTLADARRIATNTQSSFEAFTAGLCQLPRT